MAQNRKNQPAALRFVPVLRVLLLCGVIVLCCVGYVWQKKQLVLLGNQRKTAEQRLIRDREQNDALRKQLALLQRPDYLESRIKELNLGLVQPKPNQILWLPEPPLTHAATPAAGAQFLAAQSRAPETP